MLTLSSAMKNYAFMLSISRNSIICIFTHFSIHSKGISFSPFLHTQTSFMPCTSPYIDEPAYSNTRICILLLTFDIHFAIVVNILFTVSLSKSPKSCTSPSFTHQVKICSHKISSHLFDCMIPYGNNYCIGLLVQNRNYLVFPIVSLTYPSLINKLRLHETTLSLSKKNIFNWFSHIQSFNTTLSQINLLLFFLFDPFLQFLLK